MNEQQGYNPSAVLGPSFQPGFSAVGQVHLPDNVPAIPPGLPASGPGTSKVALDQNQIQVLMSMAGDAWPTLKAYWPAIFAIAAMAFGGGKLDPSSFMKPATPTNTVSVEDFNALKKNVSDLTDALLKKRSTP